MKIWMDLKVRTKCLYLVAIAVVTLIAIAVTGLYKMSNMAENEKNLTVAVEHVGMANDMKADFLNLRLNLVYMMVLHDPDQIQEKINDISARKKNIESILAKFQTYDLNPKELALIGTFKSGYEAYLAQGAKLQEMAKGSVGDVQTQKDAVSFAANSVAPLYKEPAKAVNDLVLANIEEAHTSYESDFASYRSSMVLMSIITLAATLFMGLIGMLIANSIAKPLKMVFDTLAQVAAGDLTARSSISTKDEMGMLAGEVNEMAEKLNRIMNNIAENSMQVAAAAEQLQRTSEQIATGAEEVAAQTGTVATASEEMAATASDVANSCHMAAVGGRQAMDRAQVGTAVVQQTVEVMNKIATQVKATAGTVAGLGERSEQIGEIVETIEDIADQTNLLALNAAIEAARAGDQGRGFAVVADEVRALAERTTRATREIGTMIKAIQKETKSAVDAMGEGVKEVENGTREAARSGESLQEILQQISEVTMQVNQIATAAEEQTATTGEITNNIMQITEVVQDTSKGAHTSSGAANHLASLAKDLRGTVEQFKLR